MPIFAGLGEQRYIRVAYDEQAFKFLTASFRPVAGQVDQGSTVGPLQLRHACLCLSFERRRLVKDVLAYLKTMAQHKQKAQQGSQIRG